MARVTSGHCTGTVTTWRDHGDGACREICIIIRMLTLAHTCQVRNVSKSDDVSDWRSQVVCV